MTKKPHLNLPEPQLQIDFAYALSQIRNQYLQEALASTVSGLDITELDYELGNFVSKTDLNTLASRGLRAELVFAIPTLLRSNPRLLAYYRLLLGFSQKAFYNSETGMSCFRSLEDSGQLTKRNEEFLTELCTALCSASSVLIRGINSSRLSRSLLDDLTLLTLGPQLRGSANVKRGGTSILVVFDIVHQIVKPHAVAVHPNSIELRSAAGRVVRIEFASDPDIVIREEMSENNFRNVIAIEVKGGTDYSNIHNRIGEAEKSHQKARERGFVECWTVINVARFDETMARRESPSTNRFYYLGDLESGAGTEFADFRYRIIALTGLPS